MKDELKTWVEKHPELVRIKEYEKYPGLFVLKYHRRVFYDNLWGEHPLLVDMRGTVVDEDFNPIIMPFRKIFNQYENDTNIPRDEIVIASRKVNGFMGAVTFYEGKTYYSTTGSLDSMYVTYLRDIMAGYDFKPLDHATWLFEIVHPRDPHVIPEDIGAYLLGVRYPKWGEDLNKNRDQRWLDLVAQQVGFKRPNWKKIRFSDLCKEVKTCKHEGYVVYGKDTDLKIKSPYYKVTKLFGRVTPRKLEVMLDNPKAMKQQLDEEYYPLVDHLVKHRAMFYSLSEQAKFEYIRSFLNEQR